jgi:hypothetical protein
MENVYSNDAIFVEKGGKTYALLPLTIFHDMPSKNRETELLKQFGLKDACCSKSLYEITDEKKFILAKIKYGI